MRPRRERDSHRQQGREINTRHFTGALGHPRSAASMLRSLMGKTAAGEAVCAVVRDTGSEPGARSTPRLRSVSWAALRICANLSELRFPHLEI